MSYVKYLTNYQKISIWLVVDSVEKWNEYMLHVIFVFMQQTTTKEGYAKRTKLVKESVSQDFTTLLGVRIWWWWQDQKPMLYAYAVHRPTRRKSIIANTSYT